jgi:mono/diheme cytochrome c family protein
MAVMKFLEENKMDRSTKLLNMAVLLLGASLALILVSGAAGVPRAAAHPAAAPPAGSAQDVYLDKCSVCHGQDGAGNTAKGRKLKVKSAKSPEVQKLSEAEMLEIVSKGKGKDMDGFEKELGGDMVKQLVTYYRTLEK